MFKPYNRETHKLVTVSPYIENGQVFTVEVQPMTADDIAAANKAKVPVSVSPRQIRQALTAVGLRSAVESAVASGDQDMQDWWEFSTAIERNHPLVSGMATSLNVSEAQLDQLFLTAGGL